MKLGRKDIKNFGEPYVIAEIGANHNGDMTLAKIMIDSAIENGADAVKFQSWTDKSLIAKEEYDRNQSYDDSPKKHFGSLEEMVKKYYLREEQHFLLKEYCDSKNIDFCSTPFSEDEADLLEKLNVPFYKVASMDINNFRLLEHIANKNKPVVISTGMATLAEIDAAIKTIEACDNYDIILLHCVSIYPPKVEDIHLNNITMLQNMYPKYPIGFSDHTLGTAVPLASVALGAAVIEKHFTTDKNLPGWDHEISADPEELRIIVEQGKMLSKAMGNYFRTVSDDEKAKMHKFRRSIVINKDLKAGDVIKDSDLAFKRPGTGIRPDEVKYVVGRELRIDVLEDSVLKWEDLK